MPTVEDFIRDFEISPSEMQKVIDMATEKKVVYDEKGFKNSEHAIRVRGKALVARNLYENESFFKLVFVFAASPVFKPVNDGLLISE
jgi:carboxyl-terminal processing protease